MMTDLVVKLQKLRQQRPSCDFTMLQGTQVDVLFIQLTHCYVMVIISAKYSLNRTRIARYTVSPKIVYVIKLGQ